MVKFFSGYIEVVIKVSFVDCIPRLIVHVTSEQHVCSVLEVNNKFPTHGFQVQFRWIPVQSEYSKRFELTKINIPESI